MMQTHFAGSHQPRRALGEWSLCGRNALKVKIMQCYSWGVERVVLAEHHNGRHTGLGAAWHISLAIADASMGISTSRSWLGRAIKLLSFQTDGDM